MADKMLREEVEVYSKKYDVHGVVKDYSLVTKLCFNYRDKDIEIAIHRNILNGERFEDVGRDVIETYIANLADDNSDRRCMLHYWYIDEKTYEGKTYKMAHGIVSGHRKLDDATEIHTSEVNALSIDQENGEAVIMTRNTVYHCPLEYCRFIKQDAYPNILPDYDEIKSRYKGKINYPSIEQGNVLLVLANFCDYYFHSLWYVPMDSKDNEPLEYSGWPHVGMVQDSYLIHTEDMRIDIRYFPHFQNIEFYSEDTDGCPFYIENIGDVVLFAKTQVGTIRLAPGERKQVIEDNTEDKPPILPRGDLYPAGIIEADDGDE